MEQTLLSATLGLSLGVAVGVFSSYGTEVVVALLTVILLQGMLLVWKKDSYVAQYTIIIFIFIILGIVRVQFVEEGKPYVCEKMCVVTARVIQVPEIKDDYQSIVVDLRDGHDFILVRAPLYPTVRVGDILTLSGNVSIPSTSYPHNGSKAFDYATYLSNQHIGSEMYYPKISITHDDTLSFSEQLLLLRSGLVDRISVYVKSPSDSLASGMLLGNQNMPGAILQNFRVAGLSHIVVLSGFNIAIVIATLLYLLRILPLTFRIIMSIASTILFVMMVGGTPSVIRATLMALVSLLALYVGRQYEAKNALLVSFLLVVLYSPLSLISDVSLHLSFLATAGIIYIAPIIETRLEHISFRYGKEIITTTLAAYVATLPYIMHTFGTVSLYAILANLIVIPFVSPIMLLTFVTLLVSFISPLVALVLGFVVTKLCAFVIFIASVISYLPFASIAINADGTTMLFMYVTVGIAGWYLSLKKSDETLLTKDGELLSPVMSY